MSDRSRIRPSRNGTWTIPAVVIMAGVVAWTASAQTNALFGDVLRLLALVSTACALVGTWLVLRRMAMMADAIAHSILFGIVMMFFVVQDPASPLFILGAALAGLLTVFLTEGLLRTRRVREDAAIGMVFPFLFALALVIIGLFFRDAHVDEHLVLAGGVEITVLRQVVLSAVTLPGWLTALAGGLIQSIAPVEAVTVTRDGVMTLDGWRLGPRSLWTMGVVLAVNAAFVGLLWKELKLTTFDEGLAASLGFAPALLNYALMSLVSVTAVGAFEAVGSILVIALFVTPPATAYLLTEDLGEMLGLALIIGLLAALLGFLSGRAFDVNFGGAVATAAGGLFLTALLFAPGQGLISQAFNRRRRGMRFAEETLLVHLGHHADTPEAAEELSIDTLPVHLQWSPDFARRVIDRLERDGEALRSGGRLELTVAGEARAERVLRERGVERA